MSQEQLRQMHVVSLELQYPAYADFLEDGRRDSVVGLHSSIPDTEMFWGGNATMVLDQPGAFLMSFDFVGEKGAELQTDQTLGFICDGLKVWTESQRIEALSINNASLSTEWLGGDTQPVMQDITELVREQLAAQV